VKGRHAAAQLGDVLAEALAFVLGWVLCSVAIWHLESSWALTLAVLGGAMVVSAPLMAIARQLAQWRHAATQRDCPECGTRHAPGENSLCSR